MINYEGIIKDGKHSFRDYGLIIKSKYISIPGKEKISERVPFSNYNYDFSRLYGEEIFKDREIQYIFNLICNSKEELYSKGDKVIEWLYDNKNFKLYDDDIKGYYFLAECLSIDYKELSTFWEITVNFKAYPYKIRVYNEGLIPWDDFNFETDYLQETNFFIDGTKEIKLINSSSKKIIPEIVCDSDFIIKKDSTTYYFKKGNSKDWRFKLNKNINIITITGSGHLKFLFRKEVI
ncbi:hypothetical protein [Clostridium chauvoei]|uniref:Phage tail protein n=2 Tax=Clostridium chauvoei TaxID=46867 RepID=A0A1U6JH38_9CLOT|nr:hypothetical protein [Clostridium chauvoei]MBX7280766.1 phage tail protein [Clostridium chauvoei]MBX7283249.1 phage tail protein [Clostridium chauvoei]MBX7285866.1 phage tail protein [Clostridium chauvoei]MBX7288260.1 phage tail protein [Clostridium chauvoei]MBX7290851.1 phage tail protein [Clostridium chauvoei]